MSNTQQNTSNKEAKKPTVILNLFQNLKNKWKVITVILLILITILGVLVYLPFTNNKPVERIIWEWRNTGTFSSDRVTKGDYDGYIAVRNYNFTQTKFDLFKPVYSFVAQVKGELNEGTREQFTIEVRTIYLQRTGIDSWKVTDYRNNEIRGLTLQEATTLATQHDLTTNFPNKSNYKITNYPPLTPEQIEANRKVRERSEAQTKNNAISQESCPIPNINDFSNEKLSNEEMISDYKLILKHYRDTIKQIDDGSISANDTISFCGFSIKAEAYKSRLENALKYVKDKYNVDL